MATYAGFASRVAAVVVDVVLAALVLTLLSWMAGRIVETVAPRYDTLAVTLIALLNSVFLTAYFTLFWAVAGQTLGDMLFGIRVVTLDGKFVGVARALLRTLAAFTLAWGMIWILFDNRRQALHDKLARTCVVYVSRNSPQPPTRVDRPPEQ